MDFWHCALIVFGIVVLILIAQALAIGGSVRSFPAPVAK